MEIKKGCTPRVQNLAARILDKPRICVERLRYYTESYKKTEGEYPIARQSKAFANALNNMSIRILDGELIVGFPSSKDRGGAILPELNASWLEDEIDDMSVREWDTFYAPSPEEKEEIFNHLSYWKNKSAFEMWQKRVPDPIMDLHASGFIGGVTFSNNGFYPAHIAPDYGKILKRGLSSIFNETKTLLSSLDLSADESVSKYYFYHAVLRSIDAVHNFSLRYSSLAAKMAEDEKDPIRKSELLEISRICEKVPWNPCETFYEAVQATFMLWTTMMIESWGHGLTISRPDQFLLPYYNSDISKGSLKREDALELLELFFVKLNTTVTIDDFKTATCFAGFPQAVNITLGGCLSDGTDAVNDLTYLFMEAESDIGMTAEDLVIRIGQNSSDEYILKSAELAKHLKGKLKFVSDPVTFSQMEEDGYPKEYYWDYAVTGCNSPCIVGRSQDLPGGLFNLPMLLEFALNDGKSRMTGKQVGPHTGDPRNFSSYEDLWNAFCTQVKYFTGPICVMSDVDRSIFAEYLPLPYQDIFFEGPLEKGLDIFSGGTEPLARQSYSLSGAPNVGDGLAAIKKVVFEDKKLTMDQVIDALDSNFENHEKELFLLSQAPKFGNDDPYVDQIVDDVIVFCSKEAGKYISRSGLPFKTAAATISSNVPMGLSVGALPGGRLAGTPISEGGISPHQGRNKSGPTATLNSVAHLHHNLLSNGSVLNMKFSPDALEGPDKMWKFAQLIKAYLLSGGYFVQFNIIDLETLKDAQVHPENHKDLLVRVATYSAYFVELSPDMQNDIIARMEFGSL